MVLVVCQNTSLQYRVLVAHQHRAILRCTGFVWQHRLLALDYGGNKMASLILELPGDLLDAARLDETALKTEIAIHLYEQGRLSFGKASELADVDIGHFRQLLGSRNIAVHYDVAEYKSDCSTLDRLLPR